MSASFWDFFRTVKLAASGQWPDILQALAGLEARHVDTALRNKGTDCAICGGNDRYSFKNAETGGWGCRHCGGGDGWTMLQCINNWTFSEAVRAVADYLHIECSDLTPLSPQQQEDRRKRQEKAEQRQRQDALKLQQQHQQKAIYARHLWAHSRPADPRHPYLISHYLATFNLRQHRHPAYGDCLVVPLFNEQWQLMNLEFINPDGLKRPIKGALKKGLFYQFGSQTWTLYICESWSTGAAIHLGKPCSPCVMSAMGRTNLDAVTAIALRLYPDSDVVIAADNDSPGIKDAVSVASKYNLKIVLPSGEGQDFCDSLIQDCAL